MSTENIMIGVRECDFKEYLADKDKKYTQEEFGNLVNFIMNKFDGSIVYDHLDYLISQYECEKSIF